MSPRSLLLSRLLLAAAAPVVTTGCNRTIDVPRPPLRPSQPVPSASSTAALGGDQALGVCDSSFHSYPKGRTGGPYANSYCYAPVAPATGCLASTDPALPRTLAMSYAQCVYDGPHAQRDPASGAAWCCYNLGFMGEGRPLRVAHERRQASVVLASEWA